MTMRPASASRRGGGARAAAPDAAEADDQSSHWAEVAHKLWLGAAAPARGAVAGLVKRELWDPLEAEAFSHRSLRTLENLRVVESFLWPAYSEDASNHHVMLIAAFVNVKQRERLPTWSLFEDRPADFANLFRRVLSLNVDFTLSTPLRSHLLRFVTCAFQSLESASMRKQCAPLVSISIWHNLHSDAARARLLDQQHGPRKAWRLAAKKYDAADAAGQATLTFNRSWLFSMLVDFIRRLGADAAPVEDVRYCELFVELLIDLVSQFPTRRYTHALLHDLNLLAIIRLSTMFHDEANALLRDLYLLLRHFMLFPVDDQAARQLTPQEAYERHCHNLSRLQRVAIQHFKAKLTLLALTNVGSLEQRDELKTHLASLTDDELVQLAQHLGFRTSYPKQAALSCGRELLLEAMLSEFEAKPSYQASVSGVSILPTEQNLYDPALLRTEAHDGSRPLAMPKLNLQYLSMGDFLWRSFMVYRAEAIYDIRDDLEATVQRLRPSLAGTGTGIKFDGFSRMAIPIAKPALIEVASPNVGSALPAYVRLEVTINVSRLGDRVRQEWEGLRHGDTVFLLGVQAETPSTALLTGTQDKVGLVHVRTAEVVRMLDERGRPLREHEPGDSSAMHHRPHGRFLRLLVDVDAVAYQADLARQRKGGIDVLERLNLVVRRKGRENNFRSILQSLQAAVATDTALPSWLHDTFMGFGDPRAAHHESLDSKLATVDFRDTFTSWQHLLDSFPGATVEAAGTQHPTRPPFVLTTAPRADQSEQQQHKPSRKRRRAAADEPATPDARTISVSTYDTPSQGPYPTDALQLNTVRFTPAQVAAIASGTQPGLTLVVGPPGTGKTDVATQIINNIYHNFPSQRTLLITHSNQALNQLFKKILALDIDERHLLRLGRGEDELDTDASYSKSGRVESLLETRSRRLAEVDRLARSIGAVGAHGNSCETAAYFDTNHVRPLWTRYWAAVEASAEKCETLVNRFPFHDFFADAPQPLFPPDASEAHLRAVAQGCQRHLDKLFAELRDILPLEVLRQDKDKADYMLTKEARIIAMTSTHAAIRRQEILELGIHYDNVIIEEAAQITEIETCLPLTLQKPVKGESPLQRLVLVGDHFQNTPIVRNAALRQYAGLEQSLFARLVRLGVPSVMLDQQGRARPSIADLFRWRYEHLGDLPAVGHDDEFQRANAGLQYEYQFIDVPDYQGQGERSPVPHFIQNLGEAEYAVALYQYMRLLGYPAAKITILATYAGQQALIRDVLEHRCKKNPLFGLPKLVTTVDRYQGEQNDYIILSLTRTRSLGYLRDVRRLTVALSRGRLGLYILGRRELFESCLELKPAFDILLKRPDKLRVVPGELYGTARLLSDDVDGTAMESVEHIGQYVYEMTQAKLEDMKARGDAGLLRDSAERGDDAGANAGADADADEGASGVVDEDMDMEDAPEAES
ncbi:hypothetical protein KEM52_005749 [Ascosphaera acerosa]|nr:hypothetical protein KEM52_005749 [Ascosphaera acerosa]